VVLKKALQGQYKSGRESQLVKEGKGLPVVGRATYSGRGQSLSLALLFGKIPWFDVRGEIQRCDWLHNTPGLEIHTGHILKPSVPTNRTAEFRQTTVRMAVVAPSRYTFFTKL
jgi:hypothetical protein